MIIASSSHPILLTGNALNGPVEAPLIQILKRKIYCCVLNLKFGNFSLRFGRQRRRIVLECVLHLQHDCFSSYNQSDHCVLSSSLLSSLLKLPN